LVRPPDRRFQNVDRVLGSQTRLVASRTLEWQVQAS